MAAPKGYKHENIHVFGESAGANRAITMILYLKENREPLTNNGYLFSPVICQGKKLESNIERK